MDMMFQPFHTWNQDDVVSCHVQLAGSVPTQDSWWCRWHAAFSLLSQPWDRTGTWFLEATWECYEYESSSYHPAIIINMNHQVAYPEASDHHPKYCKKMSGWIFVTGRWHWVRWNVALVLVTNLQEVPETTSACALQKAATLSLATARVEEHVAQHATVAPILGRFTKT